MSAEIKAKNLTAQLLHRAVGNPANTLPSSAISNCFPGLEYDFKNFWRRAFVGLVFLEWDNFVTEVDSKDESLRKLLHHRLLKMDGRDLVVPVTGPQSPGGSSVDLPSGKPGVVMMEWSNALAVVRSRQGGKVKCHFTAKRSDTPVPVPADTRDMIEVELTMRPVFEPDSLELTPDALEPGELTQGLCSPWQHDYRECSCYYWPASRPDYANVERTPEGVSRGDNWLAKQRKTGEYVLDDRRDSRLVSYDDLFLGWEKELHFLVKGRDAEES
jgi:hypothetical protein